MAGKILVIDDEPSIQTVLQLSLTQHDYIYVGATTGSEGLAIARETKPDLILLDLGLPDGDGVTVLQELRGWFSAPIIVLTAINRESEKVFSLDHGADDYIVKPFSMAELLARLRVALRHSARQPSKDASVIVVGPIRIDIGSRRVRVHDREVRLTATEFDLLKTLALQAGRVVTHRTLLSVVWGENAAAHTHYLRVYMGFLRRKLRVGDSTQELILTEPGVGYRMIEGSSAQ